MRKLNTEQRAKYVPRPSFTLLSVLLARLVLTGCGEDTLSDQTQRSAEVEDADAEQAKALLSLRRGPYLQAGREDGVTIKWRTSSATTSVVRYGSSVGDLSKVASVSGTRTDHTVRLTGLEPDSKYFYSTGDVGGDERRFFRTHPPVGSPKPFKIWAIGDAGLPASRGGYSEKMVAGLRRYYSGDLGVWLMLGDNAYTDGTDDQFQRAVFEPFAGQLPNTILWSTRGNHERSSSVYYSIFEHPTRGESGGVPSGTEAYYSFDYGNVHFVCLDSEGTSMDRDGAQARWLRQDLEDTDQHWVVAFWHHPPYTRSNHDSDSESDLIEAREELNPILESYGVDLVLNGHSHSYERSYLIDGHYGFSGTFRRSTHVKDDSSPFDKAFGAHKGTIYLVEGASSHTAAGDNRSTHHPVHQVNEKQSSSSSNPSVGSLLISVDGDRLTVERVKDTGSVSDRFQIVKRSSGSMSQTLRFEVDDTYVDAAQPGTNFGNSAVLEVDSDPSQKHALIKPRNLSTLPPRTVITSAELVLSITDAGSTVAVHELLGDWAEGTVTYSNGPARSPSLSTFAGSLGEVRVDVTALVQSWLNGKPGRGISLFPTGTNGVDFRSSESGSGPYLSVSLIDACPLDPNKVAPGDCGCGIPEGCSSAARQYEAEAHTAQSGCTQASNASGFTGTGFMDFGSKDSWIEWNNIQAATASSRTLNFRYANGGSTSRNATVTVNGTSVGGVDFASTGSWSTWRNISISVPLRTGNNTVRVTTSTTAGGPNVDHVVVGN